MDNRPTHRVTYKGGQKVDIPITPLNAQSMAHKGRAQTTVCMDVKRALVFPRFVRWEDLKVEPLATYEEPSCPCLDGKCYNCDLNDHHRCDVCPIE